MSDKQNTITIRVELNEDKIPKHIYWQAGDEMNEQSTKAFFLALFDPNTKDTLRMDLWTTEMTIQDMKFFMHNNIRSMAQSYSKAIQDPKVIKLFDELAEALLDKDELN